MKRKKRLQKGIESIKKQIEIHKDKLKEAEEKGDKELSTYYEGEIENLENRKENRKEKLHRKEVI